MIYLPISDEQLDKMLSRPYNPPSVNNEEEEEGFREEYWRCHSIIKNGLEMLGGYDSYGDADFCMNENWQLSRGVAVQLTSSKMIGQQLIPVILNALSKIHVDYSIYMDHGMIDIDDFFILIEGGRVYANCSNNFLIQQLGLHRAEKGE